MKLTIIIVNYNVKYFLELCLCSVEKACKEIAAEIFVVDNNSTDGSREYLEKKFPAVQFRWNKENAGFGKANNSVLAEAKGDYILFLNPDTIVPEDCFSLCLDFFSKYSDCGALGVKMINSQGQFLKESKRSFPSPGASFFKMAGLAKLFPSSKLFARYYAGHLPVNESNAVDALAGAFMMLSKEAIEKTHGFDETFFMYAEDIDLSFRIQQAGMKNYYFPGTTIIHFKGESTQKLSAGYANHFYGAMDLFVKKHYADKKATRFFMHRAIFFSKQLAVLKYSFLKMNKKPLQVNSSQNTAVLATLTEFNELIDLIKFANPPLTICGQMDLGEKSNSPESVAAFFKKNKISQAIFVEGTLSFKNIIESLQHLPKKINYLFHATKSDSIVGDSKTGNKAVFISKD